MLRTVMSIAVATPELEALVTKLVAEARNEGIEKLVAAPVIRKDNSVLILRRKEGDFLGGFWEIPGGGVDQDETVLKALIRETKEETGCTVKKITGFSSSFDYMDAKDRRVRQFTFDIEVQDDTAVTLSEHDAFEWLQPYQISDFHMSPSMRKTIEIAFGLTQSE